MRFYRPVKAVSEGARRACEEGTRTITAVRAIFKPVFAATALALACAACTSAPIDMSASDPVTTEALSQQTALRANALEVVELVDTRGWAVEDNPAQAASALLSRLIGGGGDDDAAPGATAVEAYLTAHAMPGEAARSDITMLSARTQTVAELAILVASLDGNLSQAGLARDIAASESALGAVRRAISFFGAVDEHLKRESGAIESAGLDEALGELSRIETRLARGADALAERRWATRSGLFG